MTSSFEACGSLVLRPLDRGISSSFGFDRQMYAKGSLVFLPCFGCLLDVAATWRTMGLSKCL